MKKNLILLLAISLFIVSCTTTTEEKNTEKEAAIAAISVNEIIDKASENVGKEVVIEGTITHVCKHGGKKMFLMGENDVRIKITPNEEISAFEQDLEGSDAIITGKVIEMRVDEEYLANWEAEITIQLEEEADVDEKEHKIEEGNPAHLGKHEEKEEAVDDPYAGVKDLRKQLVESGKDHLSFYSIECTEYKLK